MGKRGPKPKETINLTWSSELAYIVGLMVSDGCLSKNGRHIDFTSKDREQIDNFLSCLKLECKIYNKISGYDGNKSFRVQFSNVLFYNFLLSIGLTPAKSKTIGVVAVPDEYFFDFLRGSFDGDGCFYSYWDKRFRSSHMFYIEFISASREHIAWLKSMLKNKIGVAGHVVTDGKKATMQLKYAKKEALEIIGKMYYSPSVVSLSRKRIKIQKALVIEKEQQQQYT